MPPIAQFFLKHFWFFGILTTFANGGMFWWRARGKMAAYPELADEIKDTIRGFVLLFSFPWVVMGFGIVVGGVPTMFHFFNPKDLNPFVLAFHAATLADIALIARWIYLGGGTEFMVEHREIFWKMSASPAAIKFSNALLIVIGIVVEIAMWVIDFPVPEF
jgi:hypothetical protein